MAVYGLLVPKKKKKQIIKLLRSEFVILSCNWKFEVFFE